MNFQLLAMTGKMIAILVLLLVIVAVQLCSVGFLIYANAKNSKRRRNRTSRVGDNDGDTDSDDRDTAQEGSIQADSDPTVVALASENGETAQEDSDEPTPDRDEPLATEENSSEPDEPEFTDEQVEAMLDEFDDASSPETEVADNGDDDGEPTEEPAPTSDEDNSPETDSDDEARAFADQIEQNLAALTDSSDEAATDLAEQEQPQEETADAEEEYVESTAETVEEILEEHGLTSEDEITEEIAEEIMAVHTAHDETAVEVVSVNGLYKKYSKKADWAIANVNFHCYEGEIVGLLGHNGAGKSTTLKCLEGMLPFDEGTISIYGKDIVKDPLAAKANMGFVTDNHAVFVKMTGKQYLAFMADVYGVPTEVRKERIAKLEEVFQLGSAINNLISSYSHGMRQKICMMGSLMHQPKLWVLDEPMTGLDPRTMHAVQQFMREYADAGNCIVFSSHALITVAKMCDRVVLLRTGNQLDELNIKRIMTVDPTFDFEEYFLKHERQD